MISFVSVAVTRCLLVSLSSLVRLQRDVAVEQFGLDWLVSTRSPWHKKRASWFQETCISLVMAEQFATLGQLLAYFDEACFDEACFDEACFDEACFDEACFDGAILA